MIKFSLAGIPIGVDGWFWLMTILLSGRISTNGDADWGAVGVWLAVVFVSVLIHELGHALMGRRFGATPGIVLHGFGGSTYLPGANLSRGQSILVSASGPLAGFAAGLVVLGIAGFVTAKSRWFQIAIHDALYVNFVWTIVNLLPIHPLDGGQILREVLGPRRIQWTAWIGCILAAALCLWTFSVELYFSSFMLATLAYMNFRQEPMQGGVIKS